MIVNVPGKVAVHRRVRDPRQLLDAARDRAGVDEQEVIVHVHARTRRAPARPSRGRAPATRMWSTSSSGDVTARNASPAALRTIDTTSSTRSRRRPASRCTSMRRSRMRGSMRTGVGASACVGVSVVVVVIRDLLGRVGEADELQLRNEPHAGGGLDPRLHQLHEREHVVGVRAGLGDEEVGVLLRHHHAPDPQALAARTPR